MFTYGLSVQKNGGTSLPDYHYCYIIIIIIIDSMFRILPKWKAGTVVYT